MVFKDQRLPVRPGLPPVYLWRADLSQGLRYLPIDIIREYGLFEVIKRIKATQFPSRGNESSDSKGTRWASSLETRSWTSRQPSRKAAKAWLSWLPYVSRAAQHDESVYAAPDAGRVAECGTGSSHPTKTQIG